MPESDNASEQNPEDPPAGGIGLADLELGLSMMRELASSQMDQNTALDNKANFVLGSATVLLGTYVALLAARVATPGFSLVDNVIVGVPLAGAYLLTVLFSIQAYYVRDFKQVP